MATKSTHDVLAQFREAASSNRDLTRAALSTCAAPKNQILISRQLERYFKSVFGASPHQWMRAVRLKSAVSLIGRRNTLRDVSQKSGYKNAAHFTHDFKEYFGVCPSDFRKDTSLRRNMLKTSCSNNRFILHRTHKRGRSTHIEAVR